MRDADFTNGSEVDPTAAEPVLLALGKETVRAGKEAGVHLLVSIFFN